MDEIDFESDLFEDILAKDPRYHARAYALLMDVVRFLLEDECALTAENILEDFRDRTLDQYGPLSYRVLEEWGVTCCADIGEMMFNLMDAKRVRKDDGDTPGCFVGGYDFKEAFLSPFAV